MTRILHITTITSALTALVLSVACLVQLHTMSTRLSTMSEDMQSMRRTLALTAASLCRDGCERVRTVEAAR